MNTRILHVSDLHVGARDDSVIGPALAALTQKVSPELVIASGDLTHRGLPAQHDAAAELLRSLGPPVLAVPGNHDIPYSFPARFASPWREFERRWQSVEPEHIGTGVHVVGVNSVRPWRHQSGGVSDAQLERATAKLRTVAPGLLRVVVMHHQMIGAPWRTRKKPVANRNHVLAMLVDGGADLILGGHIHQGTVSERHEFEAIEGNVRGAVISIAPGAGQPRPHRRGEARGAVVYDADDSTLTVETHIWRDGHWRIVATRRFPRS